MTLTYDCWGHMTSVANTASGTVSFSYDSSGRRVSKTVGTVTTFNVWDASTLVSVLDSSGNPLRDYTFGVAGVLSDHTSTGGTSSDQLYSSDPQGNTTDTFDGASGVWRRPPFYASPFIRQLGPPPADPFMLFGDYSYLLDSELHSAGNLEIAVIARSSGGGRPYTPGTGNFGSAGGFGGMGSAGSPYGFGGGDPVGSAGGGDPSNTDAEDGFNDTGSQDYYQPWRHAVNVGAGAAKGALVFAAGLNPIEQLRQFVSGKGTLGDKLSWGERGLQGLALATGPIGHGVHALADAGEALPAIARASKAMRELLDNNKILRTADRVTQQLADSRLGRLTGKLTVERLNQLLHNPNAQRFFDTSTGNINVIQEVDGVLLRITTPRNASRIISVGPIRPNQVANGIASGRFVPLP